MIRAAFIALGIIGIGGFVLMLRNFVERPTNASGNPEDGLANAARRDYNPPLPPENDKEYYKMRKWWEW